MRDDTSSIPVDGSRATTLVEEIDLQRADEGASAKAYIAVIESDAFLRESIGGRMQLALSLPVMTYSTVSELECQLGKASLGLVILSLMQGNEASVSTLKVLLELVPTVPIIVLASVDDVDLARTVVRLGAKGYIPVATDYEIAFEAVRFVLAGGAYAPVDDLDAGRSSVGAIRSS